MARLSYQKAGLVLKRRGRGTKQQIKDLQRDLRQLGYLRSGIDGGFGEGTETAVKALQHDLLNNDGRSRNGDGDAPVRVLDYNKGRVAEVTELVDQALVGCIVDMLADRKLPKLPSSDKAKEENRKIRAGIAGMRSNKVPIPFLMANLYQESNLKHYLEPTQKSEDNFIMVGLDTNAGKKHVITSRGYGLGQYTLFHHPPTPEEVRDFMLDPADNLQKAITELREKFDGFVNGDTGGTQADDRLVEIGRGKLRVCKFNPDDPRFLRDCVQCAKDAGKRDIVAGQTKWHSKTSKLYEVTQYYRGEKANHSQIPKREKMGCDWPYAIRRYNGSGVNSYHYQAIVLGNLLNPKIVPPESVVVEGPPASGEKLQLDMKRKVDPNVTFELAVWLGWVKGEWERAGLGPFVVTSLKDGDHDPGSKHKHDKPAGVQGQAADIRTWHLWRGPKMKPFQGDHEDRLIQFAKKLQQQGLAVVVHPDWIKGVPHLHIATKTSLIGNVN